MNILLSIAFDALAYGMVLFIICIGLSVMMGLMRVINLAHGAFAMIGGYIASYVAGPMGWGYVPALVCGVIGTALIALPLERLLYRRVYGASDPLVQVLMTIGLTFCIIGATNFLFGSAMRAIPLPALISGPVDLGVRTVPAHRLFVIACGVVIASGLWYLIERTSFGIRLRATVDNTGMAGALGVRTDWIYTATFALAVGLAAFGGAVGAEIMPLDPYYALRYMVTFLVVVSVGGAGSIGGALVAALLLGFVDTTGRYLAPNYGEFFFYLAVIAIVFVFPHGLLRRGA